MTSFLLTMTLKAFKISVLLFLLLFLMAGIPVCAQVAPAAGGASSAPAAPSLAAPNDDVNVEVSTTYIKFTNGLSGTMIEARRPVTDYFSIGYAQVLIPGAKANFYLLGPRYDSDLAHIFKNAKPSKIDLSLIKVFVGAGLGTRRDDLGNSPAFAYGLHGGLGISAGRLLGADVGFNISSGFIGAAKQNPNGPRNFAAFSSVVNGNFAAGVTLRF